jgi:hypothetical protein
MQANSPLKKLGGAQGNQIETQKGFGIQSRDLNKKRSLDEVSNLKPSNA